MKPTPKAKPKKDIGRMTNYEKFADPDIDSDPKLEYKTASMSKKNLRVPQPQSAMNGNTVTTFSRMEEEPEKRAAEIDDIYGGGEDQRVPCEN